ncbi:MULTISPECIES: hypothetical protein [unclassified Streptomyces]|uniref:hypothetical protein n=1 Tax=unclassified Streptomyces TaxID=2593676 RepID=UPI0022AE6137|nr:MULTISPECIES: hypothetical protein [unclassified Streptomyces]MCZ4097307.1 hypothetical protein [Streptomyces sp. H39-C1]MCZ4120611.1 hypothetical protein [Streptomyces sp. H39-S7]
MAETSWPFDQGDGVRVDAARWQSLVSPSALSGVTGRWGDLALSVSVSTTQVGSIDIAPGRAIVRGFAYRSSALMTLPLAPQTEAQPRVDLVVIELTVTDGKAVIRVLKGQPAANPIPPAVTQTTGGIWQYPLAQVTVRRSTTVIDSIRDVRTLHDSGRIPAVAETNVPSNPTPGDLVYFKNRATGAEELHMYAAAGGWSIVSAVGKTRTYAPQLNWSNGSYRAKGHYQWIGSNTLNFTANVTNTSGRTWNGTQMNISLPERARGGIIQVMAANLWNNTTGGVYEGMPNYMIGTGYINGGWTCQPILQNYTNNAYEGGDWWGRFPKGATMIVNGTYEADYYNEGTA